MQDGFADASQGLGLSEDDFCDLLEDQHYLNQMAYVGFLEDNDFSTFEGEDQVVVKGRGRAVVALQMIAEESAIECRNVCADDHIKRLAALVKSPDIFREYARGVLEEIESDYAEVAGTQIADIQKHMRGSNFRTGFFDAESGGSPSLSGNIQSRVMRYRFYERYYNHAVSVRKALGAGEADQLLPALPPEIAVHASSPSRREGGDNIVFMNFNRS